MNINQSTISNKFSITSTILVNTNLISLAICLFLTEKNRKFKIF